MQLFEENLTMDTNVYMENGKFYAANNGELVELPASILDKLRLEYHKLRRKAMMKDRGIDIEAAKAKNAERFKLTNSAMNQNLEAEAKAWAQGLMYKAKAEKEADRKFREKEAKVALQTFPDSKALAAELGMQVKDFMKNLLAKKPQRRVIKSYEEPDPYETVDPRIFTLGDTDIYEIPKEDPKNEKKPLVLFYFDRSWSFNVSAHPGDKDVLKKVLLGNDIQKMFASFADKIDVKTLYFSSNVYETEQEALDVGGNNGRKLFTDIEARTKGRLANVVIVTDSDNGRPQTIGINGSVWLIFAETYDDGDLAKSIKKLTPKTVVKEFYYR